MKTEIELIAWALQLQNACNLSGVVHAWSEAVSDLWKIAHQLNHGTNWVNRHRVNRLYADKCKQLAGDIQFGDFSE